MKKPLTKKHTAFFWIKHFGHRIVDPDGWRHKDGVTMKTPITEDDYWSRYHQSTVQLLVGVQKKHCRVKL